MNINIKEALDKLISQGKIENKDFRIVYFGITAEIKIIV